MYRLSDIFRSHQICRFDLTLTSQLFGHQNAVRMDLVDSFTVFYLVKFVLVIRNLQQPLKLEFCTDALRIRRRQDGGNYSWYRVVVREILLAVYCNSHSHIPALLEILTKFQGRGDQLLGYPSFTIGGQDRQEHELEDTVGVVVLEEIYP